MHETNWQKYNKQTFKNTQNKLTKKITEQSEKKNIEHSDKNTPNNWTKYTKTTDKNTPKLLSKIHQTNRQKKYRAIWQIHTEQSDKNTPNELMVYFCKLYFCNLPHLKSSFKTTLYFKDCVAATEKCLETFPNINRDKVIYIYIF